MSYSRHIVIIALGAVAIFLYLNLDWKKPHMNPPQPSRAEVSSRPAQAGPPAETVAEPQWEDPGPYHVAYPRKYKYILDHTETCKTVNPFLILLVPVGPKDIEARGAIREMWGKEAVVRGQLIRTVFVLGVPTGADAQQQQEKLRQESLEHHDLIQSDFHDSYHNLTIKTMMMLEWLNTHCTQVSYVMKVDSDVFLNIDRLLTLLLDTGASGQDYMTGLVWWHSPVLRNPFNKFYMPWNVIAESEFPPYPLGFAYIMSLDLVEKILKVSPQIKPIYIEDAYLGMCLKRLGISPTDPIEKELFLVDPRHPLSSCRISRAIAVVTTSVAQMRSYWQRSREPGEKC
ncbi:beta-1,3-galactosyltransferase 5-like [Genypterus blacodes]|uniref:beta-1,3-galactosyltransferase 5-like n=1 Tax=Genypterus blacodes TaxID=154954 RepID=UPI003F75ED48